MVLLIDKIKNKKLQLLEELWDNAAFDDASYNTFENSIESHLNNKIPSLMLNELCFELTTVRNRNLITAKEQRKLRMTTAGFFGLSVGSHSALTWMMESRADAIKIIDFDSISASNLNRLRFGWDDIGKKKVSVVAKYLRKINPFAKIITETKISSKNFIQLFDSRPKIQIVIDAIDSINGKLLLRKLARQRKIPLISAADVGDNVMLDIERYDEYPQPEFFLGKLPDIEKINIDTLSSIEKKKLIIKLVGFKNISERMLDSLLDIGDSLSTWPQLAGTATIAGGIVVTTLKKIILGEKVTSGRYYFSVDKLLVKDIDNPQKDAIRNRKIIKLKDELGLKESE